MIQPDGWTRSFGRAKASDTILKGQGGWKAEIKDDTITTWASCGWKLVYKQGKLSAFTTPKNRTFNFIYTNGKITALKEGSSTHLEITANPQNGTVIGLTFNGKTIEIGQAERPHVQTIAGQNVIGTVGRSLNKLTYPDGTTKTFEFSVNEIIHPTLKVFNSGERIISWDPLSKMILKDNDWAYRIERSENLFSNASIERKNQKGESEFWYNDTVRGEETVKNKGGITTKTYRFVGSGPLTGNVRKIEEIIDGVAKTVFAASYDEKGNLLQAKYANGDVITWKTTKAERTMYKNGIVEVSMLFDENGRISKEIFYSNKSEKHYSYSGNSKTTKTLFADGKILIEEFDGANLKRTYDDIANKIKSKSES
jgi:hypothetical protein